MSRFAQSACNSSPNCAMPAAWSITASLQRSPTSNSSAPSNSTPPTPSSWNAPRLAASLRASKISAHERSSSQVSPKPFLCSAREKARRIFRDRFMYLYSEVVDLKPTSELLDQGPCTPRSCPNGAEAQSPGLPRAAWLPWVDAARHQLPQRGCGSVGQKPQPRWGSLSGGVRSQGRPEAGQPWALS